MAQGQVFLRILRFSLPILIPPTLHSFYLSSGTGAMGRSGAAVPRDSVSPYPNNNKILQILNTCT
jgi:hypothetical protein